MVQIILLLLPIMVFKSSLQACTSTEAITTCPWDSLKSPKPLQENNYKPYLSFSKGYLEHVPSRAFRHFSQITALQLSDNKINRLDDDSLEGLVNLKMLNLYGNQLTSINQNTLSGCVNLERLDLGLNKIASIHDKSFQHLTNLKDLNLAFNVLKSVPQAIHSLQNLQILRLDNNAITALKSTAFSSLSHLEELYLNDNKLTQIEEDSFKGLTKLNKLDLRSNFLTHIDVDDLVDDAKELKTISISLNEFQCKNLWRILEAFRLKNVKVSKGASKSPNNVIGINCKSS